MSCDKETLKQILGKTIKSVLVQCDPKLSSPMSKVMLVFTDDTAFELYADRPIFTVRGVHSGCMEDVRARFTAPSGSMEILVQVTLDEKESILLEA